MRDSWDNYLYLVNMEHTHAFVSTIQSVLTKKIMNEVDLLKENHDLFKRAIAWSNVGCKFVFKKGRSIEGNGN